MRGEIAADDVESVSGDKTRVSFARESVEFNKTRVNKVGVEKLEGRFRTSVRYRDDLGAHSARTVVIDMSAACSSSAAQRNHKVS